MNNLFSNTKKLMLFGFAIVTALIIGTIALIRNEESKTEESEEEERNKKKKETKKEAPKQEEKPMTSEEVLEQLEKD